MASAPEENQFVPVVVTGGQVPAEPERAERLPAGRVPSGQLRASDAERDEVAAVLAEALAQGRLTSAELAERIDAAYTAKTRAELVPLTADLPEDLRETPAAPLAAVERQELSATFGKVIRSGRWVAGRHTQATARFGALIVNLADAVLPGREITLDVNAFCGKAIITVPENARVVDEGGALFGKRSVTGSTPEGEEDGPLIRITGRSTFGKIVVHRRGRGGAGVNPAIWWWENRHQR
jgi:hypothetical protein